MTLCAFQLWSWKTHCRKNFAHIHGGRCTVCVEELNARETIPRALGDKKGSGGRATRDPNKLLAKRGVAFNWHFDPYPGCAEDGAATHGVMVYTVTGTGLCRFALRKSFSADGTTVHTHANTCYAFFDSGSARAARALTGAYHCPVNTGSGPRTVLVVRFAVYRM